MLNFSTPPLSPDLCSDPPSPTLCPQTFTGFILMRAAVGIGEASYSTIAPTLISDMFAKDLRSIMLAVFYFAIPIGR